MAGHHMASLVFLEDTPSRTVNKEEGKWEHILGPTSNGVAPYVGPQHIDWVLGGQIGGGVPLADWPMK